MGFDHFCIPVPGLKSTKRLASVVAHKTKDAVTSTPEEKAAKAIAKATRATADSNITAVVLDARSLLVTTITKGAPRSVTSDRKGEFSTDLLSAGDILVVITPEGDVTSETIEASQPVATPEPEVVTPQVMPAGWGPSIKGRKQTA